MNQQETNQVLAVLYSGTGRPVPEIAKRIWAEVLGPVPMKLGTLAAQEMLKKTKIYGEPQLADYRDHVNRLHREAKAAMRPRKTFSSAELAYMSPKDRDALQARNSAPRMPQAEAKAILDALDLHAKAFPARKSLGAKERERGNQQKMIEGLKVEKDVREVIELGAPEPERKPFLPVRESKPLKTEEEREAERQRQKYLLKTMTNDEKGEGIA